MANVTGSFTATGQSAAFQPIMRDRSWGQFNIELRGTFVATVTLERSLDGGANWVGVTMVGAPVSWTAPCSEVWEENERGAQYRLNCTWTSGTVTYRLSQ